MEKKIITNDNIVVTGFNHYQKTKKSGKFYRIFAKKYIYKNEVELDNDEFEMWWVFFTIKDDVKDLGVIRYRYEKQKEDIYKEYTISFDDLPKSLKDIYNNLTETYKFGGSINFTSYQDGMFWIENESQKYSSKNHFYSSKEYKTAYPIIQKLYKEEKESFGKKGYAIMTNLGLNVGDEVFYDYVSPYGYIENYKGKIIDRQGIPYVELNIGQQTISGKKTLIWNKGWRKIFLDGGFINNNYYTIGGL